MAAKNAPKPRPNKNSDGQDKRPVPTMTRTISSAPGKPEPAPAPPPPPGAPQPGASNPMTHPNHPAIQSALGTSGAPQNPLDVLHPQPDKNQRDVRENITFKDLPPSGQSQVQQQQGIDPYAPVKMVQQATTGALQAGASTGPVPHQLAGPYVPPDVQAFPDDMAHLTTLMSQGFAPGASGQEHDYAQNAHAMARAKINAAMQQGQQGAGSPTPLPYAPAAPQGVPGADPAAQGGQAGTVPGIPPAPQGPAGPALGSSMGAPAAPGGPPIQPGAPGGIPPAMIQALLAQHKQQRPVR